MSQTLSASRLANLGAAAIYAAFEVYQDRFRAITARAQGRFEQRDWFGMRADMAERLELYRTVLDPLVAQVRTLLGPRVDQKLVWASMKAVYSGRIAGCHQWELAETFYNSVTRRIFATVGVDTEIEFVDSDFDSPPMPTEFPLYRIYPGGGSLARFLAAVLDGMPLTAPFEDRARDIALGAERMAGQLQAMGLP
ncbi:MAG TPA: isocitrate dehydrogenase kinase/phosphatase AceK regulatory subunit, partial [Anaerolineae bacterium]